MRKAVVIILSGIFTATLFGAPGKTVLYDHRVEIVASNNVNIRLSFGLTDVSMTNIVQNGESTASHMIDGEGGTFDYGRPQLPAVTRFVVVPPRAGLELVVHAGEPRRAESDRPPALYLDEELAVEGQQLSLIHI